MSNKGTTWHGLTRHQRFLSKIKVNAETGCWEWKGNKMKKLPYGVFTLTSGYSITAHRYSYQTYIGEIPPKMQVCHKCDNPPCCNPFHLWLGTNKENQEDSRLKGRQPTTKCPSLNAYRKGCRCEPCVELNREYKRKYAVEWRLKNLERARQNDRNYKEKQRQLKKAS